MMTDHDKKALQSFVASSERILPWVSAGALGLLIVVAVLRVL